MTTTFDTRAEAVPGQEPDGMAGIAPKAKGEPGKGVTPKRRWLWAIATLVAIGIGVFAWWQPFGAKVTGVTIETVAPGPVTRVLAVNGQVAALQSVNVRSAVSGTLLILLVDEGDLVRAGDVLARIDSIQQAAVVRQATAAQDAGLITQAKAQASLLRAQSLGRNVSLVALEDANSALESASQEVDRLTALLDQARIQLSRYTITAPIAGTIMSIAADPGQIVDPASPILTVADLRALMVETDVDEAYATQISQGLKAVLQLVGTNQNLAGTVSFVSPQVDVTTGGLAVRISTDLPLKAPVGLTVTANIIVEDNPAAISAPRTALVTDATGSSVFVLRDGKAKITPVQPVDWPAARLIVTEGLRAGDLLIEDASGLQDGQEVAVTGDAASAAQSSVGQTPSTKDIPLPIDK